MTERPRARETAYDDDRAPGLLDPGGPLAADQRTASPRARLAADASVGLAVALVPTTVLLATGVLWEWTPLLAALCGVFALLWSLAAPTARLVFERFLDGWERHVEGLQARSPDRRGRTLPAGQTSTPAAPVPPGGKDAERQLLEAIERHGGITPARAALETTLTVAEADRMLGELAGKGYLEVEVRDGKLVYSF